MRVIVSTKSLASGIWKSVQDKYKISFIKIEGHELTFCGAGSDHKHTVSLHNGQFEYFMAKFNPVIWYRILQFLNEISEQPIVMEISETDDEDVEVEFSQFIKKF